MPATPCPPPSLAVREPAASPKPARPAEPNAPSPSPARPDANPGAASPDAANTDAANTDTANPDAANTDELLALLHLHLGAVGGRSWVGLRERFGSARDALAAGPAALASLLSPARSSALRALPPDAAPAESARARALGVRLVGLGLPGYPSALAALPDAPLVLYVLGELPDEEPRVAIVGSRRATPYALRMARELSFGAARAGVTIVSGLARGVDGEAHQAALDAGGRTIAVLGCGIDVRYPREHAALYEACRARGAVISEFPIGAPPLPGHFPRRNRIIAGLSRAVCVVAAEHRSGSLTTAAWALDHGRDVLAVPHRVGDPGAAGALALICDGAHPATTAEQLVVAAGLAPAGAPQDLDAPGDGPGAPASGDGGVRARGEARAEGGGAGSGPRPRRAPGRGQREGARGARAAAPRGLSAVQTAVYEALSFDDPLLLDEVADASGLPVTTAFGALLDLERLGLAAIRPGQVFVRAAAAATATP